MKVCPKCGHERQPKDDDFVPGNECPKCGILYDKFLEMQRQLRENEKLSEMQQQKRSQFFNWTTLAWLCTVLLLIMALNSLYNTDDGTKAYENNTVDRPPRIAVATKPIPQQPKASYSERRPLHNIAKNNIPTQTPNDSLKELSNTLERLADRYEQRLQVGYLYHNEISSRQWGSIKGTPNFKKIQSILHNYRMQHTYMSNEFFICVDMAMDVWNLLATAGIKSKLIVGNVQDDIEYNNTVSKYLSNINHAWVVAEVSPSTWIPLETTGGGIIDPSMANFELYNKGILFDNPKELKEFNGSRDALFNTCNETVSMQSHFNQSYAGKPISTESIEYIGRLKQKVNDCEQLVIKVTSRLHEG